jgi:hypothetical protein
VNLVRWNFFALILCAEDIFLGGAVNVKEFLPAVSEAVGKKFFLRGGWPCSTNQCGVARSNSEPLPQPPPLTLPMNRLPQENVPIADRDSNSVPPKIGFVHPKRRQKGAGRPPSSTCTPTMPPFHALPVTVSPRTYPVHRARPRAYFPLALDATRDQTSDGGSGWSASAANLWTS